MKPAAFSYHRPETISDALALLAEHGDVGKIIAGGQSLVPSMNFRLARPETLIDMNAIAEIAGIEDRGDTLVIGAMTRHAAFHTPVCDGPTGAMLTRVVGNIAHYPIRQRGTFGGSLCHADPASEWCLVAATFDAAMEIHGQDGMREVGAADFFKGTFTTAVGGDELLARIHLPKLPEGWGTGFYEFSRRRGDFALAMAVAALKVEGGKIADARLGVGAVAAHGLRLETLEQALTGQPATEETIAEVAAQVPGLVKPSGDIHGSAEYRRDLAQAVVRRALNAALADCAVPA
ncbi:FAD binding domain-containing protein [Roseisalinus antarcticus]|uniref:Caffeine dehydrogenase subunit beta n=1 Tax=Roseisalinus antarcticus TaxID=254357 RepID=A0A1Y5TRW4_9RHOB|nr:xanthine dehydrogenase family protein subunit M [Roseisalinus antarcticus]SLN70655.1 Caffeine dehydrogenase subunit beta [Roseisalinus antarcticus]